MVARALGIYLVAVPFLLTLMELADMDSTFRSLATIGLALGSGLLSWRNTE